MIASVADVALLSESDRVRARAVGSILSGHSSPGHWPVCGERGADTGTWPEPAITAHTETARHRSRIHSQGHGALDTAHRFCHSVHFFTISQSTHRVTLLLITLNLNNESVIILQYWHNNAMELLGFQRASLPWQSFDTIQYINTCLLT